MSRISLAGGVLPGCVNYNQISIPVMMSVLRSFLCLAAVVLGIGLTSGFAQTGKIAGTITDAETGDPLPGVNVLLLGEQRGATTNVDGYYVILNVPPGAYNLRASFVGYATQTVENVGINIDLTSEVDIELQEETQELQEVVVQAQERVVKADISSSRIDVSTEDIENMPVADITEVVGLQAGIQGMSVRGGNRDELDFRVDGASMVGGRAGNPYTDVSYTAVKEVQVQSGGFNAEYGNVRSGVVNVVTREGPRTRYTVDMLARYSPPTKKHFGPSVDSPDSYWIRPYLDDQVKLEGTSNWEDWTRRQYPEFQGYRKIARASLDDDNPNNDLTPFAAEQLFRWRHRRDLSIQEPDYVMDGSIGGPVPGIGQYLGDLRFFASYRQVQEQYIIPLSRRGFDSYNGRLKLTSNITPSMKLNVTVMQGLQKGTRTGAGGGISAVVRRDEREQRITGYRPYGNVRGVDDVSFAEDGLSIVDIGRKMVSADFTHTLSSNTFYELQLKRYQTEFTAGPIRSRDTETPVQTFAGFQANEAPMGFSFSTRNSIVSGLFMAGHNSILRDTTTYMQHEGKFDLTSQVNRFHQFKGGARFNVSRQNERVVMLNALTDPWNTYHSWNESPRYFAAYAQDKIEFEGMIANLGLRLDYLDPNTQWYTYDQPFQDSFMGKNVDKFEQLIEKKPIDPTLALSPRVGISFPVTETSKLFFNYGHFIQKPDPEYTYMVQRSRLDNRLWRISNPGAPLPKTTAYELGYEHSLFNQFLVRVAGYYKDVRNQPRWIAYHGRQGLVDYTMNMSTNYEDIRGFEVTLYKNVGRWVRGFVNYSYMVHSAGNFGFGQYYESRVEQRRYERDTREHEQYKPLPQPYARVSIDFLTPTNFGPSIGGAYLLGDWRFNLLGRWKAGSYFTYTGENSIPGVQNNFQWPSFRMVDARLSKNINILRSADAQFFVDVNNLFNMKNFNTASFSGGDDFDSYMYSLKLPEKKAENVTNYTNEFGEDLPGDADKEYIDPPNLNSIRYLFPRNFYFGLRLSF